MNTPDTYHGFVYKTIFPNGKIYIGQTIRRVNGRYFGSGTACELAVKKFGKENMMREILKFVDNQKDLDKWEKVFIIKFNSTNKSIGYNIEIGSFGRGRFSEEIRLKISIAGKGRVISEQQRQRHREFNLGRTHTEETKTKIGMAHKGKVCTEEIRENMRILQKGKTASEETKAKMSMSQKIRFSSPEERIKVGIESLGRKMSDETKAKLRIAHLEINAKKRVESQAKRRLLENSTN